jgi:hypothetical protein
VVRVGNDRIRPTGAAQAEVDATPRALRVIQYDSTGVPIGPTVASMVKITDAGGVDVVEVDATPSALRVVEYPQDSLTSGSFAQTAGLATVTLIAAPGAGLRLYITSFSMGQVSAGASNYTVQSGAVTFAHPTLRQDGGFFQNTFTSPWRCPVNTSLTVTIPAGGTAWANAQGYILSF